MMFGRSLGALLALPLIVVAATCTGQARSMMLAEPPSHLIDVSSCSPQRPLPSAPVGGFVPAYYPFGPYTWIDPYGFSYEQFPTAATNGSLAIDYMNVSAKVMKTIDFGLVARGRLVAEVRDVGTFSPHAEIKHQFGLDPNVFPLRTALSTCVPLHIVFADGTSWKNPHLPPNGHAMYKHHPR